MILQYRWRRAVDEASLFRLVFPLTLNPPVEISRDRPDKSYERKEKPMPETETAAVVAATTETAPAVEKAVNEKPARKKIKFFAHYEPAELSQMEKLYTSTLNQINQDEIVKGCIVSISNKDVTIDVGYKSEGIVSLLEFRDEDEIKVGR